ncbi:MAG: hypothetical protein JWQ21_2965 [Herminiimonas sp.]|nr:hypothetical protein [Herminiimonas sp.]
MAWPTLNYSRSQVTKAGQILISDSDRDGLDDWLWAYDVLTNWRACHGYPVNTFQATLRQKLKRIDANALVAQRLKRLPSIRIKLHRNPSMSLARMQDIGGLRAVVGTMRHVRLLHDDYKQSRFTHALVSEYDYIGMPKPSGYRGIHMIYKYRHRVDSRYDGLQIELQIRTKLQHAWATAVETVGTFLQHSLKSSEGPDDWLKFFSLIGSAFAHIEESPLVPGYDRLTKENTFETTAYEANRLGVRDMLVGYSNVVNAIPTGNARGAYYLVELILKGEKKVTVTPFTRDQLAKANEEYSKAEKRASDANDSQVVLVSAGSIDSLRRAYPNYFLDTHDFLKQLSKIEKAIETS